MADFTRLPSVNTNFRPQQVASGSEGHEVLGEVFGKIGKASIQEAIEVNNEVSNASLYQATNQIYRLQEITNEELAQNPDQTKLLVDTAKNNLNNIIAQTPVNKSDRSKLDYLAKKNLTDIELKGLKTSNEFARTQGVISFSSQWPEALQQIQNSWNDDKALEYRLKNTTKLLDDAVKSRFITPLQYTAYADTLHMTLRGVKQAHDLFVDQEKHSAKNYHKVTSKIHQTNTLHQVGLPTEENTNYLYKDRVNQFNKSDISAAIYNDKQIDVQTYSNLNEHQRLEIDIERNAVNEVKAMINSGESWDSLDALRKDLDSRKDVMLTSEERAKKVYLDNWFKQYANNKYLRAISTTPIGSQISHEHHMNIKSAETNTVLSPEEKYKLIRKYDNQFVSKSIAAGMSTHTPPDKIQPINDMELQKAKSSFSMGGDPSELLKTIDYYDKEHRVYVANGMSNPVHQEIAYTVGLLEGETNNGKRAILVAANQKGIDWSPLKVEDANSIMKVRSRVETDPKIKQVNDYISRMDGSNGKRSSSLIEMTTRAVGLESMINKDYRMDDYEDLIGSWGNEYSKGYDIQRGSYYQFNKKQHPELSEYEWQALANHARESGYEYMKSQPGRSNVDLRQSIDQNPIYVTITPDNWIVALDQYGNSVFGQYYDQRLLAEAKSKKPLQETPGIELEGAVRTIR